MLWARLTGNNAESRELRRAYNVVPPPKGFITMTIFFQCVLGTALFCCGFACIQTFTVEDKSGSGSVKTSDYRFTSVPDISWIFITTTGLVVLMFGFFGIWMSDRRPPKLWCLTLSLLLQVIVTGMSVASVAVIPIFHPDKVGHHLICSTFILQGFLLAVEIATLILQAWEFIAVAYEKRYWNLDYPTPVTDEKTSLWKRIKSVLSTR